jgi:hypothetical protein
MPKKPTAQLTVQVDEANLKKAQRVAGTKTLTPEEERTLRMRHGVSLQKSDRLGRKDEGVATLRIELDAMEFEAFRAMGHIYGLKRFTPAARNSTKANPQRAPHGSKDKIIRALKRK